MNRFFNKLVRDKIPEKIRNNNEIPIIKVLNDKEYKEALITKLLEEYNEVIKAEGEEILEELADMLEVIEALANVENKTFNDIMKLKETKKEKRGGFSEKIYLIETKSNID